MLALSASRPRASAYAGGSVDNTVVPGTSREPRLGSDLLLQGLLRAGAVGDASVHLGRRWTLTGPVIHGAKLGRTLGFPTANLTLGSSQILAYGVYAVRLRRANGTLHDGVASYGRRPTFDNGAARFETFVFDFSGDLYGEIVTVSLFERLRGEERFDSVETLVRQMARDADGARVVLGRAEPLTELDRSMSF